jgi:hypothetical protein
VDGEADGNEDVPENYSVDRFEVIIPPAQFAEQLIRSDVLDFPLGRLRPDAPAGRHAGDWHLSYPDGRSAAEVHGWLYADWLKA